jgi:transposase
MKKNISAHVVTTTRRYKGKVYHAHLLRRSYREGGKVKKETIANLTPLGDELVEIIRCALRGEEVAPVEQIFEVVCSPHHGHVQAVRLAMKRLGFDELIASKRSRERDLVVAMVAARILKPNSKLATTRWWHLTTLPDELGAAEATEDDLYAAMDWLLDHQTRIEKKLAMRHLREGGMVLYDLTSSYLEGETCSLAALGHNRDGKKGKLQVNYGLLTDERGCPVSVSAFSGNTADPTTVVEQVTKVQETFNINKLVLVGDRGMISQQQIDRFKEMGGVDWITALRSGQIRKLLDDETIQFGLFDERNLFQFTHPDFPGERLVVCRNPLMAERRAHKRQALLQATIAELDKVKGMVERGRLTAKEKIGLRVGRVVNKYKVAKHFQLNIEDGGFNYRVLNEKVASEAALDGLYVIRTSLSEQQSGAEDAVRYYKDLAKVEQAFRSLKSIDLAVRPIYHYLEKRVRAHIFLCMLAYYVQWHMKEAWREMMFSDEDQQAKKTRDPVAPAKRSAKALEKVHSRTLENGSPVHSFQTLLESLATIVRDTCRRKGASPNERCFTMTTIPNAEQQQAFDLLDAITV